MSDSQQNELSYERVFAMSFAGVYPHYVAKVEKKGRTREEVDEVIRWLTGYTKAGVRTGSSSSSTVNDMIGER